MLYKPAFITRIALLYFTSLPAFSAEPTTTSKPERPLQRYTPTVQLIERCIPAVASIQTFMQSGTPGVFNVGVGSASVIHSSGYLITNNHVVNGIANGNVIFPGMQHPLPFKVVAGMSSEDMALIKAIRLVPGIDDPGIIGGVEVFRHRRLTLELIPDPHAQLPLPVSGNREHNAAVLDKPVIS